MSADRLLTTVAHQVQPEIAAERKRVMDAIGQVVDDCLQQWKGINHPVAEALVKGFAYELCALSRFVRTGVAPEVFAKERRGELVTEVAIQVGPTGTGGS